MFLQADRDPEVTQEIPRDLCNKAPVHAHRPDADAGGTYLLPRQIGMERAMGAALFAEKITARQAADWEMVWEAVPVSGLAGHIAARGRRIRHGDRELALRGQTGAVRQPGH